MNFKSKKAAIDYLKWDCRLFGTEKIGFTPIGECKLKPGEVMQPRYFVIRFEDGYGIYQRNFFVDTELNAPNDGRVKITPIEYVSGKKRRFKLNIENIER